MKMTVESSPLLTVPGQPPLCKRVITNSTGYNSTVFAGKEAQLDSGKNKTNNPKTHQRASDDKAIYIDTSIPGVSNFNDTQYEARIDERYLDVSKPSKAYRLESFRASSSSDVGSTQDEQLRCFFVFKCNFFEDNVSETETDLSKISDKSFYEKATDNTKAIYQSLIEKAVQRSGPVIDLFEVENAKERRIIIAYRQETATGYFSALSHLYHYYGLTSTRKYVEQFSNGITIASIYLVPSEALRSPVFNASSKTYPPISHSIHQVTKEASLLYCLPRNSFQDLFAKGEISLQESIYAHSAFIFVSHFLNRLGSEYSTLNSILDAENPAHAEVLENLKRRLRQETFTRAYIKELILSQLDLIRKLYLNFAGAHYIQSQGEGDSFLPTLSYQRLQANKVLSTDELKDVIRRDCSNDYEVTVFNAILLFNANVLKTNFYTPTKVALSFRLNPEFLLKSEYPQPLYGMFLVVGQEFRGFHLRFRDVARGGIRIVKSRNYEAYSINARSMFDENYNLANTQQRKNKDIPEGGSKGVILLNPEHQDKGTQAFQKYIDSIIDLLLPGDIPGIKEPIVDLLGQREILFMGPDENTAGLVDWATLHAKKRGAPWWKSFFTGKSPSVGGIPHDVYGMTSLSVREYVKGIYRKLNIDPSTVRKMQTGGPDGDLGSNEILLSNEKYVSIIDGSGVLHDPNGLNHGELIKLAKERVMISQFDVSKLSPQGYRVLIDDKNVKLPSGEIVQNGTTFRNLYHLRPEGVDALVPCGGRPEAINLNNVGKFIDDNGNSLIPYIVEGANLFITQNAKLRLEKAGAIIFKDASANKGGVTSSSLEVLASLAFDDEGFFKNMCISKDGKVPEFYTSYVKEVQEIIKNNARLEFEALWRENSITGKARSILSDELSNAINDLTEELSSSSLWEDVDFRNAVLSEALPKTLQTAIGLDKILERAFNDTAVANKDLASSTIYFLDLVAPYVSHALLRAKFTPILTKLSPVFTSPDVDAPLLRSSIGILEILLIVQDTQAWNSSAVGASPRRGLMGLLAFTVDPRPKVRKRAQEAITNILSNPPAGPSLEFAASTLCAESALQSVAQLLQETKNKPKKQAQQPQQQGADSHNAKLIHSLQLVKAITAANGWPVSKLEALCEMLLSISRTTEQYLVIAAFDVFESIFKSISAQEDAPKLLVILDSIFDLKPSVNDQHLVPAWLAVIAQATESYAGIEPRDAFIKLPKIFKVVVQFLDSESSTIHVSATQCLVALCSTAIMPENLLLPNDAESQARFEESEAILAELATIVFGLLNVKYQSSWKEVMSVLDALFEQLRWRADPHLINCLKVVGTLRSDESLAEGRQETDTVIGSAIRNLGPQRVLELFPLNLTSNNSRQPGRAWLLPLLRDNVQFANLKFFTSDLVRLAGQLEAEIASVGDKGKLTQAMAMKIKIFETLIDQIWSTLPKFCDLPFGLQEGFDNEFAELLINVLYKYVEFRPYICQGLKLLVESNKDLAEGKLDEDILLIQRIGKETGQSNLEYLSKFAPNLLSGLFNVFSKTPSEGRGYILECITAYLSITSKTDIENTFNKVATVLHSSLQEEAQAKAAAAETKKKPAKNELPPTSTTMMDLIIPMVIYLPQSSHNALLSIFATLSNESAEALLQKKACRVISKLSESEAGQQTIINNLGDIEKAFLSISDKVTAPARGARLQALSKIVSILPSDHFYFIPSILSEAVLCTKDINEKTREAAFNLIVQMGNAMKQGGVIDHSKVPGMEAAEGAAPVQATLEEYFTMVSAGLAGSTPHMISATITALSRALFEFRAEIQLSMLQELSSTVELFLTSNNREIVKSTLGFVKITATILPEDVVKPALKSLIGNLLVWSHEHNSHFKSKVKHIIERLIRRFGFQVIEENFPESDLKLLTNIRKSRERSRRNKKLEEEETAAPGTTTENLRNRKHKAAAAKAAAADDQFDNEFDRAIYGSSSDDSDSEDEESGNKKGKANNNNNNNNNNKRANKYIVEGDEPLDLLDQQTLAHITSTKPQTRQQNQQQRGRAAANHFKKDAQGRLIITDPEATQGGNATAEEQDPLAKLTSGIDAYVEAIKNGPVRGQRNKLKFRKSKGDDDVEMEDDDQPRVAKKQLGLKGKNSGKDNRGFKGGKKDFKQNKRRFYN
ncbi:hypothetical protein D0Z00_000021 [Geotrichum galactomycetum]|uniref:Uncharacterized protein n=1 Tax=Geotrichum galactomycetum TaxID=27317 RepID=A0ACB6VAN6_9ASCO|nr:hypothetical protein D0Z00_000021 [Geotrichum candidum]